MTYFKLCSIKWEKIGASGAGKSTLLDILAGRQKRGEISGDVNIEPTPKSRRSIAFIDQDDNLMATLTVWEIVLASALLRLPRGMSNGQKRRKAREVLQQLDIWSVRDSLIGDTSESDTLF